MNKVFIISLLLFSFLARGEESCPIPGSLVADSFTQSAVGIAEKKCNAEFNDSYLDLVTGCLSGGWKAGESLVDGIVSLTKMLLVEAPKWVWIEAKKKINEIRKQNISPLQMAQAIANIQVASHSDIFAKAQEYWKTFEQFSKNLKETLLTEIDGFPCLPKFKQSEIICQGVSTVFLTVFTPASFINGARWTANTGKAVVKFAQESKKVHGLENASLASRLERATDNLKGNTVQHGDIVLGGGILREVELADGQRILQYQKKVKGNDGKMHVVNREVPVDAKTKSIDANTEVGKDILTGMVQAQKGSSSLVFIDVNHLGKVNYFKGGTQAGDEYLTHVAEALRKSIRPGDQIFKNGGDELVIILKEKNPQVVKSITQRMIQEVDSHPKIRSIFREEVKTFSNRYREINRAHRFEDIPESVRRKLLPSEVAAAHKNFDLFKKTKLEVIKSEMIEQASYKGSVSVGSSLIKEGDSLASTLLRAERQASRVKVEYKARLGHDISKYNISPEEFSSIRKWSPPQALDPN